MHQRVLDLQRLYEYERLLEAQHGVCAICGQPPKKNKQLHVDHNHVTGVVRGLLCTHCNTRIAFLESSLRLAAEAYLRKER